MPASFYMESKIILMEERILNKARELFFSFGIRSVTMDDIAKQMGVSKKTIYQFYTDKNQIVAEVIRDLVARHESKIESFCKQAENAIHEVVLQSQSIADIFQSLKPGFFFEVQKHFPDTWNWWTVTRVNAFWRESRAIWKEEFRKDFTVLNCKLKPLLISGRFS